MVYSHHQERHLPFFEMAPTPTMKTVASTPNKDEIPSVTPNKAKQEDAHKEDCCINAQQGRDCVCYTQQEAFETERPIRIYEKESPPCHFD
jgi:hypothetical protein